MSRLQFSESFAPGVGAVDREKMIIRGVKVLGLQSRNTGRVLGLSTREFGEAANKPYRYSADAVRASVGMYEGVAINVDHPASSYDASGKRVVTGGARRTADRFGRLVNVRAVEDGLTGDIEYLASHPLASMVLEVAERMPEQLALSHVSDGNCKVINGEIVVSHIESVRSVDLIAQKPGTTTTLFESQEERAVPKTIREIVAATRSKSPQLGYLVHAIEMGGEELEPVMDTPVDVPSEATEDEAIDTAMDAAMMAVIQDDNLSTPEKIQKLKKLLTTKDDLLGKTEEKPAEPPPDEKKDETTTTEEGAAAGTTDKLILERLEKTERELKQFKARDAARQLLESKGAKSSEVRIKAVSALESEADRVALVEEWVTSEVKSGVAPRSQSGKPVQEDFKPYKPDGKRLASAIR